MTAKIFNFPTSTPIVKHRHVVGEAFCLGCKAKWVSVASAGTTDLECPQCLTRKGLFKFAANPPDVLIAHCQCGNNLFYITETGDFCPNCGLEGEY